MSDDVLAIESSEQDCSPRELYEIVYGSTAHYLTSATRDIAYGGNIYKATAMGRGEIGPAASGQGKELEVTLPVNHAAVRRYLRQGIPPKQLTVTLRRMYVPSGDVETRWIGDVTSMAVDDDGTEATFRVGSRLSDNLLRVIPNVMVERLCPHVLYSAPCGVDKTSVLFKLVTTALYVNGNVVRYDQGNTSADGWARRGELKHVASGEVMTVRSHGYVGLPSSVVEIEMQFPIPGLQIGDEIEVYAGCDKTIEQCVARFDNRLNFGGLPSLPENNPFIPGTSGTESD